MSEILLFILLGLGQGALIASLALGIVLNYRGSGAINIGMGAVAMLAAFTFYALTTDGQLLISAFDLGAPLAKFPAFLITLLFCAVLGTLWDVVVLRALRRSPPLAKLVASLGLLLLLQAIVVIEFGEAGQTAPSLLGDLGSVTVFDQLVPADRLVLTGLILVLTAALSAWYRWTRFGISTRAAAENETTAMLNGLSPNRLSMANTVPAFVLVAALGVLVAPIIQLDPVTISVAVMPALGAVLLAGFTSFPIAALTGLGMGSLAALVTYLQTKSWFPQADGVPLPGVTELIYFIVIVVAIFFRGVSIPERGMLAESRLPVAPTAKRLLTPTAIAVAIAAVAILVLPFDFRQAIINSLIGIVVCLSLVLITGFVGQVSLAQVTLAGVSGFVVSKLAIGIGIGFPIAPLIGASAAVVVGLVVAVSALRVRGVNLAIVTLSAAIAIERFGFENPTWGAGSTGAPVSSPHLFGLNLGPDAAFSLGDGKLPSPIFAFVCLASVALLGMLVASVRRSTLGQQMLAVRSNERAAAAIGIGVREVKFVAFGLSAFVAGLAGALYAYSFGAVTPLRFGVMTGLAFVAFAYLGGITTVSGAVVGGLLASGGLMIFLVQELTGLSDRWELVFAGVALIATVVANPGGIVAAMSRDIPKLVRRLRRIRDPGGGGDPVAEESARAGRS